MTKEETLKEYLVKLTETLRSKILIINNLPWEMAENGIGELTESIRQAVDKSDQFINKIKEDVTIQSEKQKAEEEITSKTTSI